MVLKHPLLHRDIQGLLKVVSSERPCALYSNVCFIVSFHGISVAFQEDDIEIVGYRHYNTKVFLGDHQIMFTVKLY